MSEALEQLKALEAEEEKIVEDNRRIRDSIESALMENKLKWTTVSNEKEAIILEMLETEGLNVLINDADRAEAFYRAHWSNGSGSIKMSEALRKELDNIPYLATYASGHIVDEEDYNKSVARMTVAIPRGAESDKIDALSDFLRKVFEVQEKIMGKNKVSIGVFEDSLSENGIYSIRKNEDNEFYLSIMRYHHESSVTGKSYKDLRSVIEEVAQSVTYSATDAYEDANPGWDDKDDSDFNYMMNEYDM